jgi:hypothetical protein
MPAPECLANERIRRVKCPGKREWGMKLFHGDSKSAGIEEPFVTLIRVAQENPDIKSLLLKILSFDSFNRESALNTIIEDMQLKSAPREIVSAIAGLLDSEVAEKALKLLNGAKTEE